MKDSCAYEGVNGVNFSLIVQSFALGPLRQLFQFLSPILALFKRRVLQFTLLQNLRHLPQIF